MNTTAAAFGLCQDLNVQADEGKSFRCHNCGKMKTGSVVFIPDGVEIRAEPLTSLSYGTFHMNYGWCVGCARVLSTGKPWWAFWR